jgi:uncharacterized membrane protein YeiH
MNPSVFHFLDIVGTVAFSISGVFAAMKLRLDIFGILIIAFMTAIGGGTVRDVMTGDLPVNWMRTSTYSIAIFSSAAVAMLFYRRIIDYEKILMYFDAIGVGFFTIVGIHKGLSFGFSTGLCIALGTITACFGGLLRDIVLNQIPHIFQKEIYATACVLGGMLYFLLLRTNLTREIVDSICIFLIVLVRVLAMKYNWSLPVIYKKS